MVVRGPLRDCEVPLMDRSDSRLDAPEDRKIDELVFRKQPVLGTTKRNRGVLERVLQFVWLAIRLIEAGG